MKNLYLIGIKDSENVTKGKIYRVDGEGFVILDNGYKGVAFNYYWNKELDTVRFGAGSTNRNGGLISAKMVEYTIVHDFEHIEEIESHVTECGDVVTLVKNLDEDEYIQIIDTNNREKKAK